MSLDDYMPQNSRKSPRRVKEKSLSRNMSRIAALILAQVAFYLFVFIKLPKQLPTDYQKAWSLPAAVLFALMVVFICRWFLIRKGVLKPWLRLSTQWLSGLLSFSLIIAMWVNQPTAPIKRIPDMKPAMIPIMKNRRAKHDVHKLTYYIIEKGLDSDELSDIAGKFGITPEKLAIFFDILKKNPLPPEKMRSVFLDQILRDMIDRYDRIYQRLFALIAEHPDMKPLQIKAKAALEHGDFDLAEDLVRQIDKKADDLAKQLAVSRETLNTFFVILHNQNVPAEKTRIALQDIAKRYQDLARRYHENLNKLAQFKTNDAEVRLALDQAHYFLDQGEFGKAETLINRISSIDVLNAKSNDSKTEVNEKLSQAAEAKARNADLTLLQEKHEKAAGYLEQAATILPREQVGKSVDYLKQAGQTLETIGHDEAAQTLYEKGEKFKENALTIDGLAKLSDIHRNRIAGQLAISPALLQVFFTDIQRQNSLAESVNDNLQRLAQRYHSDVEKIQQFETQNAVISDYYPDVQTALVQAHQAVEVGDFLQAESALQQAQNTLFNLSSRLNIEPKTLITFFSVLKKQGVAPEKLERQIHEFARSYREDQQRLYDARLNHPEIIALLGQAQQWLEQAEFTQAEQLIQQANARSVALAETLKIEQSVLKTFLDLIQSQSIAAAQVQQQLQRMTQDYQQTMLLIADTKSDSNEIDWINGQVYRILKQGEIDKADTLLNQISEKHILNASNSRKMAEKQLVDAAHSATADEKARSVLSVERLQQSAKDNLLAAAEAKARNAALKQIQFKNDRAAVYFQEAARLIEQDFPEKARDYLSKAQAINH